MKVIGDIQLDVLKQLYLWLSLPPNLQQILPLTPLNREVLFLQMEMAVLQQEE